MIKFKDLKFIFTMVDIFILIVSIIILIFLLSTIPCFCKICKDMGERNIILGIDDQGNQIIIERDLDLSREYFFTNELVQINIDKPYEMVKNEEPDKTCIICLEPIGEIECKLKCGHGYHFNCIKEWAYGKRKNTCPHCRETIIDIEV